MTAFRTDSPLLTLLPHEGMDLAVWEWAGSGPPLLFLHATGFHGRCWDQVIRRLPGRRCFAFDLRGHGRSSKPEPPYSWLPFASDSAALAHRLGVRGGLAVGHSMGGHTAVAAAIERPELFAALVLLDPTLFAAKWYGNRTADVSFIARRRNIWNSVDEMFERFRGRTPFSTWDPATLRDYCEWGLLPAPSGEGYVLACPPHVERSIYEHSAAPESNLGPRLAAVVAPVVVLRAAKPWAAGAFDLSSSPTDPELASHFTRGRDVPLEDRDHYFPMESPDLVADEVERALAAYF